MLTCIFITWLRSRLPHDMAEERNCVSGSIPPAWAAASGPSLRLLSGWLDHLRQRAAQLSEWTTDLTTPHSVWLPGLFNPQSFLTAVMQSTARKNGCLTNCPHFVHIGIFSIGHGMQQTALALMLTFDQSLHLTDIPSDDSAAIWNPVN